MEKANTDKRSSDDHGDDDVHHCKVCNEEIELMECPICNKQFPIDEIDAHASNCNDFEGGFVVLDKGSGSDLEDWHVVDNEEEGYSSESENQKDSLEDLSDEKVEDEEDELVDDFIFLNGIDDADFVELLDSSSGEVPKSNNSLNQNNTSNNSNSKTEDFYFSEFVDHQKAMEVLRSFQEVQSKRGKILMETKKYLKPFHTEKTNQILEKYLIRSGVKVNRKELWRKISGLHEFNKTRPNFYTDSLRRIFGDELPTRHHVVPLFGGDPIDFKQFFLNEQGKHIAVRILCVLGSLLTHIDYCPVLPNLVALLLHVMNEDETFKICYIMSSSSKYFALNVADTHVNLLTFEDLISSKERIIFNHMKKLGIKSETFAKGWFNNLFVSTIPFQSIFHVFDAYLYEGFSVMMRVGLAILSISTSLLLKTKKAADFFLTLKNLPQQVPSSVFHRKIFKYFLGNKIEKLDEKNKGIIRGMNLQSKIQIYHVPKPLSSSSFMNLELFELLYSLLDERYRVYDPYLLFSSKEHGFSLSTLINRCKNNQYTIILIQTFDNQVFGGFLSEAIHRSKTPIADEESFIFTIKPEVAKYGFIRGSNRSFFQANDHFFQFGDAGEGPGLKLDDELYNGSTFECLTYGNKPLTGVSGEFQAQVVEVWGFSI